MYHFFSLKLLLLYFKNLFTLQAEIHRNGNEESSSESCKKPVGQSCDYLTQGVAILVQIHLYGRDVGKCCWSQTGMVYEVLLLLTG